MFAGIKKKSLRRSQSEFQAPGRIGSKFMVSVFGRSGYGNRGIKVRRPGDRGFTSVTEAPTVSSVLVEPFFGSNAGECRLAHEKAVE